MPRLAEKGGRLYEIRRKKTSIGRHATNDIQVDDNLASRQHAQIVYDGHAFYIVDNLSLNGTYVNSERVDEAILRDGDEIRIGGHIFTFESTTIDPRFISGDGDTTLSISKPLDKFEYETVISEKLGAKGKSHAAPSGEIQSLRNSHKNMITLYRLSQAVNSTLHMNKLMEVAVDIISRSLPARLASISLLDDKTGELEPQAVKLKDGLSPPGYAYFGPMADRVLQERVCVASINPPIPGDLPNNQKVGAAMAVPLWIKTKIIGLLYVDNDQDSKAYTEAELDLLIAMANTIAVAIENARLYRQLENSLNQIKDQQTQMIQMEKLAGIGTLSAGIAHELNNPLQGIMGMAEAIQTERDRNRAMEYAGEILEYSQEAARIIRDLQSYSRASKGEGLEPVNINDVIEDALQMAGHTGMIKDIEIRKELGEIPDINADAGEMKQVIMNLMQNAAQAMSGKGRLSFATWAESERVYTKIADDGPGIPEEDLSKIYDPFFTTKNKEMGTGLGLNIVFRIVTKFGGEIHCESKPGVGTVFTLCFPTGGE